MYAKASAWFSLDQGSRWPINKRQIFDQLTFFLRLLQSVSKENALKSQGLF